MTYDTLHTTRTIYRINIRIRWEIQLISTRDKIIQNTLGLYLRFYLVVIVAVYLENSFNKNYYT
jgi:hypothetical protein